MPDLVEQNPWWQKKEKIEDDPKVTNWKNSLVQWQPRIMHRFEHDTDLIYTLRGPRQVGKTTTMMLMIRHLLETGVDPRNIFYWSCDLVDSSKDLVDIVGQYLDFHGTFPELKSQRMHIFIDEVSLVKNWQNGIKYLYDRGKLKNCTLLLSGSHNLDIRTASEKLPGRRGVTDDSVDKIFLPMKFPEFVESLNPEINAFIRKKYLLKIENRKSILNSLFDGLIPREVTELSVYSKELRVLFDTYLLTGGIPIAVHLYRKDGRIPSSVFKDYINAILGDIHKWGLNETQLKQILPYLIETMGTPISWRNIEKNKDTSFTTAHNYTDLLRDSFVLNYLYKIDRARGPRFESNKKVHFSDPFIFHALRAWVSGKEPYDHAINFLSDNVNKSKLVESVVCNHLIRALYNLSPKQIFDYTTSIFFWTGKKDREVDFVIKPENTFTPIEVKYQNQIDKQDLYGLFDFMKGPNSTKGIVLSKENLETRSNCVILPVHLFLMFI